MISVTEAKHIIQQAVQPLVPELLALPEAAGLVLAEDIYAPEHLPRFAQSAMDGYALQFEDLKTSNQLVVGGEVAAGDDGQIALERGTAIRIFTGAPLPQGTDAVVMQEKTSFWDGVITVEDEALQKGSNVRTVGSEIEMGQMALPKGTVLSPGATGLVASMGLAKVWAFPAPKITLLITGKELVAPGNNLALGQVYESNSFALLAALKKLGVHQVRVEFVADTLLAVQEALVKALALSDMVLVTGGVSVGKYDFVVEAVRQVGIEQLFHKVAQKPAKPLFFGMGQTKPVFGLPGNPGAVLTCFYLYVLPAIAQMMQHRCGMRVGKMPLAVAVHKKAHLTYFLKGRIEENAVIPLCAQESFRLRSFAFADCLIELAEGEEIVEKGSMVQVHHL